MVQVPPDQRLASRSGVNSTCIPSNGRTKLEGARIQAASWSPEIFMIVDIRITLMRCRGESRRFLVTGRQQSRRRFGEPTGLHRGLRAGHVSPGGTRELGRATYLLVQHPEWGTGRPKALACAGASPRTRAL